MHHFTKSKEKIGRNIEQDKKTQNNKHEHKNGTQQISMVMQTYYKIERDSARYYEEMQEDNQTDKRQIQMYGMEKTDHIIKEQPANKNTLIANKKLEKVITRNYYGNEIILPKSQKINKKINKNISHSKSKDTSLNKIKKSRKVSYEKRARNSQEHKVQYKQQKYREKIGNKYTNNDYLIKKEQQLKASRNNQYNKVKTNNQMKKLQKHANKQLYQQSIKRKTRVSSKQDRDIWKLQKKVSRDTQRNASKKKNSKNNSHSQSIKSNRSVSIKTPKKYCNKKSNMLNQILSNQNEIKHDNILYSISKKPKYLSQNMEKLQPLVIKSVQQIVSINCSPKQQSNCLNRNKSNNQSWQLTTVQPKYQFLNNIQIPKKASSILVLYIELLSRICGQLEFTTEIFQLAQYYFGIIFCLYKYDERHQIEYKREITVILISCLYLGIKVDDSGLAKPFLRFLFPTKSQETPHQSISKNHMNYYHCLSASHQNRLPKQHINKSNEHLQSRLSYASVFNSFNPHYNLINIGRRRVPHRCVKHLHKLRQIVDEIQAKSGDQYAQIEKTEILRKQKQICFYLSFRLHPKTLNNSIYQITYEWDKHIILVAHNYTQSTLPRQNTRTQIPYLKQYLNLLLFRQEQQPIKLQLLNYISRYFVLLTNTSASYPMMFLILQVMLIILHLTLAIITDIRGILYTPQTFTPSSYSPGKVLTTQEEFIKKLEMLKASKDIEGTLHRDSIAMVASFMKYCTEIGIIEHNFSNIRGIIKGVKQILLNYVDVDLLKSLIRSKQREQTHLAADNDYYQEDLEKQSQNINLQPKHWLHVQKKIHIHKHQPLLFNFKLLTNSRQ